MRGVIMVLTAAVLGLGGCVAGENATTTTHVVDRYVEALGGRAALESLSVRVCEGRFIDDRPYRGPLTESPVMIRTTAGRAAEIVEADEMRTAGSDVAGERDKLSWLLDPRGALSLAADFPGLRYDGDTRVNGVFVHRLVSDRDPDHYALHFDTTTGLLVRIGHYMDVGDYREVDGVMVPHRVDNSRKGGSNTWVFERVSHE